MLTRSSGVLAGTVVLLCGIFLIWVTRDWGKDSIAGDIVLNWLLASIVGAGVYLLIFAQSQPELHCIENANSRLFPHIQLKNVLRLQRHRSIPVTAELPNFGFFCGCILTLLVFVSMLFSQPQNPAGLRVQLFHGRQLPRASPWTSTLSVYIDGESEFQVNGKLVPAGMLEQILQGELRKRAEWTVYLEADENCEYGAVIHAIDSIQSAQGKLFWITSRVRSEWGHASGH